MRSSSILVLALGILIAGPLGVLAAPTPTVPAKQGTAEGEPLPAKEATLRQGMPSAEVERIMGKPDEITPMEAPTGKAAIWTYRTRTEGRVERLQVGSRPITTLVRGADGAERTKVIGQEPIYGTQRFATVRTFQILMFNDHLLNQKVDVQEERKLQ